jgi:hypothetical protein
MTKTMNLKMGNIVPSCENEDLTLAAVSMDTESQAQSAAVLSVLCEAGEELSTCVRQDRQRHEKEREDTIQRQRHGRLPRPNDKAKENFLDFDFAEMKFGSIKWLRHGHWGADAAKAKTKIEIDKR